MAEVNKGILIGRLTRDPEIRNTQSGVRIANFTVAVGSRRRNQQTGEWEDGDTLFMDCNAFDGYMGKGGLATVVEKYARKGSLVYVEGRLKQERWQDKQTGQNRSKIVMNVNQLQMLDTRKEREESQSGGNNFDEYDCQTQTAELRKQQQQQQTSNGDDYGGSAADEDIPF